ncbi:MAG: hypothetical protein PVI97_18895 [Candidatus Thiodiazotropha sp.]
MSLLKGTKSFQLIFALAVPLAVLLSGCSRPMVKPSGLIVAEMKPREITNLIYSMGTQCWEREWSWFRDGIVVELSLNDIRGEVISARWDAPDLGRLEPFFMAIVSGITSGSSIETRELDCEGCTLNNTSDVKRWISGDRTCAKKET